MTQLPIVRPFAALRYARADLSALLAPPYDVISAQAQARLEQQDPYNVVRLELAYAPGAENEVDRYHRAAARLQAWKQQGVLRHDEQASLYPYALEFEFRGERRTRTGVFAAVRLTPFAQGVVLPHEGTLRGPRQDRRRLMLACQAQISPVLVLHDDPEGRIAQTISRMMEEQPTASAQTNGERHRLWRQSQQDLVNEYCALVGPGPLFIADGHHRYETALAVSEELAQSNPGAPDAAAFRHVLALLCPAPQSGVVILATHRLLRLPSREDQARLRAAVERHFTRCAVGGETADPVAAAQALTRRLEQDERDLCFGMYTRSDGCLLLRPKSEALPAEPGPGGINQLATVLIHRLVVDPVLEADGSAASVEYVMDEAEAAKRVAQGEAECVLFLRPTTVEQVKRVAAAGLRMPGKSTYFYPKAPTGLVLHDISPGQVVG